MHTRTITFTDYSEPPKQVTEKFYFHLSKLEIMKMDANHLGGMKASMTKILATNDNKSLLEEFTNLVLLSYGLKSDDGLNFEKSDALRTKFEQSAAFEALFDEIITNEDTAADFFNGIVPPSLLAEAQKEQAAAAPPIFPPTPPPALQGPPPALPSVDPYGPSGVKIS